MEPYIATGREPHHLDWHTFLQQQTQPPLDSASAAIETTVALPSQLAHAFRQLDAELDKLVLQA